MSEAEVRGVLVDAIRYIEGMAQEALKPVIHKIDGRTYFTNVDGGLEQVPDSLVRLPDIETVILHSLTGLTDYIDAEDFDDLTGYAVHVERPAQVTLVSKLTGEARQRFEIASAIFQQEGFPFKSFLDQEEFVIKATSMFVDTPDRARMLKLAGNIKDESVSQFNDDGITQTVKVRQGISRVEDVDVENPFILAPFRTFPEVEQPGSPFILRLKSGSGGLPTMALFEADGGAWANAARTRVKAWLEENLDKDLPILA